jgi:hypothetical protein
LHHPPFKNMYVVNTLEAWFGSMIQFNFNWITSTCICRMYFADIMYSGRQGRSGVYVCAPLDLGFFFLIKHSPLPGSWWSWRPAGFGDFKMCWFCMSLINNNRFVSSLHNILMVVRASYSQAMNCAAFHATPLIPQCCKDLTLGGGKGRVP